jgi:hypothetical protein
LEEKTFSLQKKLPLLDGFFWMTQAAVACKNILTRGRAFPSPNKVGAQILFVVYCIPADKYAMLGSRQARPGNVIVEQDMHLVLCHPL